MEKTINVDCAGLARIDPLDDPVDLFKVWRNEVITFHEGIVDVCCLATLSKDYKISSRNLLLREFDNDGFIIMTDARSRKVDDMVFEKIKVNKCLDIVSGMEPCLESAICRRFANVTVCIIRVENSDTDSIRVLNPDDANCISLIQDTAPFRKLYLDIVSMAVKASNLVLKEHNPYTAMCFLWNYKNDKQHKVSRQVRIEGPMKRLEKPAYEYMYDKEPLYCKIRSYLCHQDQPADWDDLNRRYNEILAEAKNGENLSMPDHYVAYKLAPEMMEFFYAWDELIADRIRFEKNKLTGRWEHQRIAA